MHDSLILMHRHENIFAVLVRDCSRVWVVVDKIVYEIRVIKETVISLFTMSIVIPSRNPK